MKFVVDMPLSPRLAEWLARQGHDAVHAGDIGLSRSPDTDIIRTAVQQRRIIITADLDYPRLLAVTGATSPGLVLFRGGDWGEQQVQNAMSQILASRDLADLDCSIVVVEKRRIRRRRLPLDQA